METLTLISNNDNENFKEHKSEENYDEKDQRIECWTRRFEKNSNDLTNIEINNPLYDSYKSLLFFYSNIKN